MHWPNRCVFHRAFPLGPEQVMFSWNRDPYSSIFPPSITFQLSL